MPVAPLDRVARLGCARHALLIAGLLVLAIGIAVARNWGAVSRALGDASAMAEGADEARALETPDDLLDWIRRHPDRGTLVVWDLKADSAVMTVGNAGALRPAVALPLVGPMADLLVHGDTAAVPASALRTLPGVERPSSDSAAVPFATLARRALRGDRAAGDAILLRARTAEVAWEGGVPLDGLFVAWAQSARADTLDTFLASGQADRAAWALSRRLRTDDVFRDATEADLAAHGLGLSLDAQRRAAAATFPRLRATILTREVADLARGDSAALAILTEPATDSLHARGGARLGVFGGGFPGLQSTAGVLTRADGRGRVVVLLLDGLPHAVFYHLAQTGLDVGLVLDQLGLDE
ncbi:hypothetical protein [Rubrivirga marina]|uniref:Uncharacterized protein n=1 Tax=Rubrivirga marina TaxID=1196024 RepID=A0A271IV47_9BACT|nr:hypothetical protein [Rubrivirga marina]PAP75116.1 hypothetical protein BSZ37_00965 [Rubrivirga marina]